METQQYKRTLAGSVGAGVGALFNGSGRTYFILEHKTDTEYHHAGESQKIIVDQIELGRDAACQVRFGESSETVSRRHAAIQRDGDGWQIINLSQTNATYVNGMRIQQPTKLNSGDEIRLSSQGPVMGFIVPMGAKSLVSSIGMTERLNLFRKQALRPYKVAIVTLSIILVLAVAGLIAWNLYQNKIHEEQVDGLKLELEAQNSKVETLSSEAESANLALQEAKDKLNSLENASAEQKAAAEAAVAAAAAKADAARAAANNASRRANELREQLNQAIEEKNEAPAKNETSNIVASVEDDDQSAVMTGAEFSDISSCEDAVYYIKVSKIDIFDRDGKQLISFNTEHKIGGTGFLLEDGRFVTAHRVIEPWYFYTGVVGRLGKEVITYTDLRYAIDQHGCDVVAHCTAYSPSGSNFNFSSKDMRKHALAVDLATVSTTETLKYEEIRYTPTSFVRKTLNISQRKTVVLRFLRTYYNHDWATMAKRDQLSSVGGLKFSNVYSYSPKNGDEVAILGYPAKAGFNDSQSVHPDYRQNNINATGLNDLNVIELTTSRWKEGNDGAPVLTKIDGNWTVIGVLSHTDSADRDNVTPIANAN